MSFFGIEQDKTVFAVLSFRRNDEFVAGNDQQRIAARHIAELAFRVRELFLVNFSKDFASFQIEATNAVLAKPVDDSAGDRQVWAFVWWQVAVFPQMFNSRFRQTPCVEVIGNSGLVDPIRLGIGRRSSVPIGNEFVSGHG